MHRQSVDARLLDLDGIRMHDVKDTKGKKKKKVKKKT